MTGKQGGPLVPPVDFPPYIFVNWPPAHPGTLPSPPEQARPAPLSPEKPRKSDKYPENEPGTIHKFVRLTRKLFTKMSFREFALALTV